jgi:predicted HTH domain antitoxin
MSVTAESLNPSLRELQEMNQDVKTLEKKLKRRRRERNELVLQVAESGTISMRQLAKYAGVSNVWICKLMKGRNNGV